MLYLFNAVGFRALLSDQQYTVVLLGLLSLGTLLAAVQMDYKLLVFGLFVAFCAHVMFMPTDNAALAWAGEVFHIADPQAHPATAVAAMAVAGFIASLIVHFFIPRRAFYTEDRTPASSQTASQ